MYQNRKFNPDEEDIDAGEAMYPSANTDPNPTPIQLVGSVYGAERDDLTLRHQGLSILICFGMCYNVYMLTV